MWASTAHYQATASGKLHSLHWLQGDSGHGGWLASGVDDGVVGVSWMSKERNGEKNVEKAKKGRLYKSSFNLRRHTGEVRIVRFRPQGNRLATYDSWGHVKLWGNRANVFAPEYSETISNVVRDMQWSVCGYFIVICGEEGYVEILSGINCHKVYKTQVVSPHLYSTQVEFVCCTWNVTNTQVALGTTMGEIFGIDPDEEGQFIFTTVDRQYLSVISLHFFGSIQEINVTTRRGAKTVETQSLSAYLSNGDVVFFPTIISQYCACIQTHLIEGQAQWNAHETMLAIVGYRKDSHHTLAARFLDQHGDTILTVNHVLSIPQEIKDTFHSMCWGLNDSMVFLACGNQLYSMVVEHSMPQLRDLCRQFLSINLSNKMHLLTPSHLPLPRREIEALNNFVPNMIPVPIDLNRKDVMSLLFEPIERKTRLLCLLICNTAEEDKFTLFYEHMSHFIPLLKAEKVQKKGYKVTFSIYPAFPVAPVNRSTGCTPSSDEMWAAPQQRNVLATSPGDNSKWRWLRGRWLQHVRPSSQSVMDTPQNTASGASRVLPEPSPLPPPSQPIIAEIKGNTLTNRYKFTSSFHDNKAVLGDVNICTHYIRCAPRKLTVTLANPHAPDESLPLTLVTKSPDWNAAYGIFELDFGGRINRDSVKNYQFEHEGEVVYQMGRTDNNNFILDFQYPFSPVTALCVSLSSIIA